MDKYILVSSDNLEELQKTVNEIMDLGYVPTGGVAIGVIAWKPRHTHIKTVTQAMILREETSENVFNFNVDHEENEKKG